jgi:esterase
MINNKLVLLLQAMDLHYKIQGNGKPVIILHGLFGSLDNWQSFSNQLSMNGYQVITVDLRNHGRSGHSNEFNYAVMAADIKELIENLHLNKPVLLGHSLGGKVAMVTANNYPAIVLGIIVVDIAPRYYPLHHMLILEAFKSINLADVTSRKHADQLMSVTIDDVRIRQFLLKNLYRTDNGFAWRINLNAITSNIKNVGEAINIAKSFLTPSLFVKGEHSGYITPDDELFISNTFKNVKIVHCKNAGHWVHAESPDCLMESTLKFITGLSS